MKRKNLTRNALFSSIIALLLCVSMLVGTTFAWFTDEVKSGMNNIVAGNLDIELEYTKDPSVADSWADVSAKTDLFSGALWEPGHTEVVYLRLANKGTLALNYQIGINVDSETGGTNVDGKPFKLSDYIQFGVVENQDTKFADRAAAVAAVTASSKKLNEGYTKASSMVAGAADAYMALVVYMPESVGNEANYLTGTTAPTIGLGINVVATQKAQEIDSFGPDYDVLAQGATVIADAPTNGEPIDLKADDGNGNPVTVASFTIPASRIADPDEKVKIEIIPTTLDETLTIADDEQASTYEIKVSNLNDEAGLIWVEMQIGTGRTGVKVYHKNVEITDPKPIYNPNTGRVTFQTSSFSPYTIVYDAVPVVEEEGGEGDQPSGPNAPADLPQATVTAYTDTKNIEWGDFGQWSPTEGLEANLEAAYTFTAQDTQEEAEASPYANWYCDFYVKLDRALDENEIFLGGNYGSFGWVGFHNGDVTLAAGEEIPLLGSVTQNPWTYTQIVGLVREFICGVGDVNDALAGATFTVSLRLTNPENEAEFYDVATINYTFEDNSIKTADALLAALAAGSEVKLGADIDMGSTALTVAKNVTLDLNGNVLSGTCNVGQGYLIMVNNGATLNVKDTSAAQNGKITYAKGDNNTGWTIDVEGKLNLYSGTIELTGEDWSIGYAVDVRPNAWGTNYTEDTVFHMYGGKVVSSDGAIRVASSSSDSYGNIVASFVMDGGSVNAAWDGVFVQQSNEAYDTLNVAINGGTVTSALSPIRVYGPTATSVNAGTAKPMTITAANSSLVMNGTPDETRVWHTLGKIVIGGGMTLENLNQYATITLN